MNLHDSNLSHELFLSSWNASYKVDLRSKHVGSCYLCFVFFTCHDTWMGKCVKKEGIVLKPVGRTGIRDCWLTVWSLTTSGQVLAGWLLTDVLQKTICWGESTEGNRPARKPLVITQPTFMQDKCKKEATAEKERSIREGEEEKHRQHRGNSGVCQGRGSVFERCPGHKTGTWEIYRAPNYSVPLCLLCEHATNETWQGVLFA